jgi:hypothetical protein
MNGCGGFSFLWLRWNRGGRKTSMVDSLGSSTPCYRAPLTIPWAPTWSRRWQVTDLLTYRGGNGHNKRSMGRRLRRWSATVRLFSGEAPTSRSSPVSSSWPPLAPGLVQWLQLVKTTQNWRRLGFDGFRALWAKIRAMGCTIYKGF